MALAEITAGILIPALAMNISTNNLHSSAFVALPNILLISNVISLVNPPAGAVAVVVTLGTTTATASALFALDACASLTPLSDEPAEPGLAPCPCACLEREEGLECECDFGAIVEVVVVVGDAFPPLLLLLTIEGSYDGGSFLAITLGTPFVCTCPFAPGDGANLGEGVDRSLISLSLRSLVSVLGGGGLDRNASAILTRSPSLAFDFNSEPYGPGIPGIFAGLSL